MARSGEQFWNPAARTLVVFVKTPGETGGRELVVDWIVAPGERLVKVAHLHPGPAGVTAERFELISGSAEYRVGRAKGHGTAPYGWDVPCNASHVHPWNSGQEPMHVRQTICLPEPDMALLTGVERFFETLVALSQQGRADRNGNIRGHLQNALSLYELLVPGTYLAGLPQGLQRAALGGLAALARRRGLLAYMAPQPSTGTEIAR